MGERIELRLGVEKDHVREEVEGVMDQVDAVGDAAQPAEKSPARDGSEPSAGLRNHGQQESAIKKREPCVADGDGDPIDGVYEPPEQAPQPQEEDKQQALQQLGAVANEFTEPWFAPRHRQKHA